MMARPMYCITRFAFDLPVILDSANYQLECVMVIIDIAGMLKVCLMFDQNLEEVEEEEEDPQEVEEVALEEEDQRQWVACLLQACPSSGQLEVSVFQCGFLQLVPVTLSIDNLFVFTEDNQLLS